MFHYTALTAGEGSGYLLVEADAHKITCEYEYSRREIIFLKQHISAATILGNMKIII